MGHQVKVVEGQLPPDMIPQVEASRLSKIPTLSGWYVKFHFS
ncbi:hypothetical protein AKJ16_DCAP22625 [Drosera capensis]